MHTIEEGYKTRYRTVAKMKMLYNGKTYDYEEDFGYAYGAESAKFMFEDGNYGCDCNRSLFLNRKYGKECPTKECGYEIEITEFSVEYVKP